MKMRKNQQKKKSIEKAGDIERDIDTPSEESQDDAHEERQVRSSPRKKSLPANAGSSDGSDGSEQYEMKMRKRPQKKKSSEKAGDIERDNIDTPSEESQDDAHEERQGRSSPRKKSLPANAGLSDGSEEYEEIPMPKKSSSKKKGPPAYTPLSPDVSDACEEYEIERVVDVHIPRNGERVFKVRWSGFRKESDTWEPEGNLKDTKALENFLKKMKEAKKSTPRQLRVMRKHTEVFTLSTNDHGRRLSKRNSNRQRVTYFDAE